MKTAVIFMFLALFSTGCAEKRTPIDDWQSMQQEIREEKIDKSTAAEKLARIVDGLKQYSKRKYSFKEEKWAFPLTNSSRSTVLKYDFYPNAIYGPYKTRGYDFFEGNKHGGHPAHDIFIRDRNQDSYDDKTKKPVNVVTMTDALVLSICYDWKKGSKLRGGKYVWSYNPAENKFFYYAHLKNVLVQPGQFVKKGDTIGTVGRTGMLAAVKKSATHVHLTVLEYKEGKMKPYDFYKEIKRLH
ncbi:MAG: M23 family metallopeptidase [Elusimicrobiota bacterium]